MNKVIFLVLLLATCGYAWWRGGGPERVVAFVLVVATLLTMVVASSALVAFERLETGIFAVDAAAFLAFAAVGIWAARSWPLLIAALQLVTIFAHAVPFTATRLPWAYAFMLSIWSYPILLVLVVGTWRHAQRVRRYRQGTGSAPTDWIFSGDTARDPHGRGPGQSNQRRDLQSGR